MSKWNVVSIPEYDMWFDSLTEEEQDKIMTVVVALESEGPQLSRPFCDHVKGAKTHKMKELRIQIHGDPFRVLFAFDEERSAVLLIGGDKGGEERWYKENIPIADQRFAEWTRQLRARRAKTKRPPVSRRH